MLSRLSKIIIASSVIALCALAAGVVALYCSGRRVGDSASSESVAPKGFELLEYVPSDALGFIASDNLKAGIERLFEPQSIFRDLDFEGFSSEKFVISYHFVGNLVPMLVVSDGKSSSERSRHADRLIAQASAKGLYCKYYPAPEKSHKRNVILLCGSENVLSAAIRHVDGGTSILEARSLCSALQGVRMGEEVIVFKPSCLDRLLPKDFMKAYEPRKSVISFTRRFSDWVVLSRKSSCHAGAGEYVSYAMSAASDASDKTSYALSLDPSNAGECRVAKVLPLGATYLLDLCFSDFKKFREDRQGWLDACGNLNSSNSAISAFEREKGINPVKWFSAIDLKEVAKVNFRGETAIILRAGTKLSQDTVQNIDFSGMTAAVFGSAFSLPDETSCRVMGDMLVVGSERSSTLFAGATLRRKMPELPLKGVSAILLADDISLCLAAEQSVFSVYHRY